MENEGEAIYGKVVVLNGTGFSDIPENVINEMANIMAETQFEMIKELTETVTRCNKLTGD